MKFEKFRKIIKNNKLSKITVVSCDEHFYIKKIVETIKNSFKKSNYSLYYGEESTVNMILKDVESFDMFSSSKLVVLINPEKVEEINKIAQLISNKDKLNNRLILLTQSKKFTNSKVSNSISKKNKYHFKKIYEKKTFYMLKNYIKSHNKYVTNKAINYLIERTENNIEILYNEVDKLITFCFEKDKITIEDVKKLSGNYSRTTVFDIQKYFREKDKKNFFKNFKYISNNNNAEILVVLKLIYNEIKKIITVKNNINKSRNQLSNILGLHTYVLKLNQYKKYSKRISYQQLSSVLKGMYEAEFNLKIGKDSYFVFYKLTENYF